MPDTCSPQKIHNPVKEPVIKSPNSPFYQRFIKTMNSTSNIVHQRKFVEVQRPTTPMLRRTSTSEAVVAVYCGDQSRTLPFAPFSFTHMKDKIYRQGSERDDNERQDSPSPVNFIGADEFRKLKETMRSTGVRSTNGVRHALYCCPSSPH